MAPELLNPWPQQKEHGQKCQTPKSIFKYSAPYGGQSSSSSHGETPSNYLTGKISKDTVNLLRKVIQYQPNHCRGGLGTLGILRHEPPQPTTAPTYKNKKWPSPHGGIEKALTFDEIA